VQWGGALPGVWGVASSGRGNSVLLWLCLWHCGYWSLRLLRLLATCTEVSVGCMSVEVSVGWMSVEVSVGYMSVGWACGRARGRGALGEGPSGMGD
jgi:hypothetical protein